MKHIIALILLSASFAHASVVPADNSQKLVTDELFPYQWGLFNQEQTLVREKDDIHNMPVKGVRSKDIGWDKLVGKFSGRRPIVAVLDSGVDLNHPELQGNLWKNEGECGKDPSRDNDGNRLAGDCNGWNFTEAMDSEAAKKPGDLDGHGTHIAGIIAALNNGTGMVGVVPNALIMPIKVMRDSTSTSTVPSSEAFARGIIYAVDNGADVINMSLGWPRSLETKALRDAVYYALGNGVPIVAAAGNNNSSEPLYPCAYDGVICVGASTINGNFASFSNYGGHVDTVAPGEGILGLHPVLFEPDFFSVPGYELRSGTSQAAPFVAGLVAALKASQEDITIDEIFARLYQAPALNMNGKYIQGGEATWELLAREVSTSVLRPVFKNLRQITFKGNSSESLIPLTVRNFGILASDISVTVESLSSGIKVTSDVQQIPSLKKGQFVEVRFPVSIVNMTNESNVRLKVTITHNGESQSFINEIPVVRDIRDDEKFVKSTFSFADKQLPVGTVRDGEILPYISTLESYNKTGLHQFFMKRTIPDTKQLEITLFTKVGNEYAQHDKLILIDDALVLVNFLRADLNFDGQEDYILQTLAEKDGVKFFKYSFYDKDLNDLWPTLQHRELILDLHIESFNKLYLMKMNHPELGDIMVPAHFTMGMLPKVDQPITSWEKYDTSRRPRLYYLEPFEGKLRIRSLTTNVWEEKIKKELKTKWFETVELEQVLPPSHEDVNKGNLRALVSVGLGTKRQLFIHTLNADSSFYGKKLPQLVLQGDSVDPVLQVTEEGLRVDGEVFFNIYDRTRSKLVRTKGDSQVGEYIFRHDNDADLVAGHIATFATANTQFSVYQTREELVSVTTGQGEKRTSRPKLRYSFLSHRLLSEMYYPVSYNRNGNQLPALYVDATAVTGNRIYMFEEQDGELVSSIRNSILVPPGCRALNPKINEEHGGNEFVFLCIEEREFVIRSYEMN